MRNAAMRSVIVLFFALALISPALAGSMMERWNHGVNGVQIPMPDGLGYSTLFWDEINHFPHPTFKGGSEQAYEIFAQELADFLEDEFSYLENRHLFTY